MKSINKLITISFILTTFVFARSEKCNIKVNKINTQLKNNHYWVKDISDKNNEAQLERKRSHKRRRKIRKPIKGLR